MLMSYYNYHGIAMNLIKNGHYERAEIMQNYNKISPALVLFFDNHKPMPIREKHFEKYIALLNYYEIQILSK